MSARRHTSPSGAGRTLAFWAAAAPMVPVLVALPLATLPWQRVSRGCSAWLMTRALRGIAAPMALAFDDKIASSHRWGTVALLCAGLLYRRTRGLAAAVVAVAVSYVATALIAGAYLQTPGWTTTLCWAAALAGLALHRNNHAGESPRRVRAWAPLWAPFAAAILILVPIWARDVVLARNPPARNRVVPNVAYDLLLVGAPPVLYFTDQSAVRRVRDPYRTPSQPETFLQFPYAERMHTSVEPDTFFVAASGRGARRMISSSSIPEVEFVSPTSNHTASLAHDVETGRLWVMNEWNGSASVFDKRGALIRSLQPHEGHWTLPWVAFDSTHRRAFLSSMMMDGDLVAYDMDTLRVLDRREGVFSYQSVFDAHSQTLFATRLFPGELLAIDPETLGVRASVRLGSGCRGIALDRRRHHVLVATYPTGTLYRIDTASLRVLESGSCGWRCRSLFVDEARDTLWTASRAGIYRFALSEPLP